MKHILILLAFLIVSSDVQSKPKNPYLDAWWDCVVPSFGTLKYQIKNRALAVEAAYASCRTEENAYITKGGINTVYGAIAAMDEVKVMMKGKILEMGR